MLRCTLAAIIIVIIIAHREVCGVITAFRVDVTRYGPYIIVIFSTFLSKVRQCFIVVSCFVRNLEILVHVPVLSIYRLQCI